MIDIAVREERFWGSVNEAFQAPRVELEERVRTPDRRLLEAIGIRPYNPDELVQRKGLPIYNRMLHDAQVKACISTKLHARLSTPWRIIPASASPRDLMVAEFLQQILDRIEGSFEEDLYEILQALVYGYSLLEIVWEEIESGPFRGKIGVRVLKSKDPQFFDFGVDDFLNIREIIGLDEFGGEIARYNPQKFLIFSWNKHHEKPYGVSDLRAAYRDWWTKDVCYKLRNISAERLAQPIIVGKLPPEASRALQDNLFNVIKKVQTETGVTLPPNVELTLLEAKSSGSEEFQRIVDNCNCEIAKAILAGTLTIEESKRYGSYAVGKIHYDVLLFHIERLGRVLAAVITDQLLSKLVWINFGADTPVPRFAFAPFRAEPLEKTARAILSLVQGGVVKAEDPWVREKLGLYQSSPSPRQTSTSSPFQRLGRQVIEFCEKHPERLLSTVPINVGEIKSFLKRELNIDEEGAHKKAGEIKQLLQTHLPWIRRNPSDFLSYCDLLERAYSGNGSL
jgi:phage gp29-like protein